MCRYCKSTGLRGVWPFRYKCAHCKDKENKQYTEKSYTTMEILMDMYEKKKEKI